VFTRVTLPLVRSGIGAGLTLAWARALGEFGATVTFAGSFPGRTRTLPLEVYRQLELDPDAATALAMLLLGVAVVVLVALRGRWTQR
jgi:molybdate transport system permease protein